MIHIIERKEQFQWSKFDYNAAILTRRWYQNIAFNFLLFQISHQRFPTIRRRGTGFDLAGTNIRVRIINTGYNCEHMFSLGAQVHNLFN